jgi:hypothetical protein
MREFKTTFVAMGIQVIVCILGIVYAIIHALDKAMYKGMTYLRDMYSDLMLDDDVESEVTTTA